MTATDRIVTTLRHAGWCDECRIEPLGVTGNNRVLRAAAGSRSFVVKEYFQHPDDPRDRFKTERAFYTFLWEGGVRRTPEPLAWFAGERFALFEFVPGAKPAVATPALLN